MANNSSVDQMVLRIRESSLAYEDFIRIAQISGKTRQILCSLIKAVYSASELEGVSQVLIFLELILEKDLDLAAYGADALYNEIEANGHLGHPKVFHLYNLAGKLVHKLQQDPSSRSSPAAVFQICGLMKATQGLLESIHCNWIQVLRSGDDFRHIADAARSFPDHVDIPRLLRQGYSNTISDALKAVDFVESLRPNFRLVMLGYGQLFERLCTAEDEIDQVDYEDPVDTDGFMELVQRFKEASEDRGEEGDSVFRSALEAIPAKIRTVFFPPSGYCVLHSPQLGKYAVSDFNILFNGVTTIVKDLSPNCRYELSSYTCPDSGGVLFKIVEGSKKGCGLLEPQNENISSDKPIHIVNEAYENHPLLVARRAESLWFRYKLKPWNRGNSFTINNVTVGGVMAARKFLCKDYIKFRRDLSGDTQTPTALWEILDYGGRC